MLDLDLDQGPAAKYAGVGPWDADMNMARPFIGLGVEVNLKDGITERKDSYAIISHGYLTGKLKKTNEYQGTKEDGENVDD